MFSCCWLTWPLSCQEYDEEGSYREPGPDAVEPQRLRFSYYTAGSGGVGPTILATSMLLAGEPVVAFKDGEKARQCLSEARYQLVLLP